MYELKEELNIENMIYEIRGKQVMLDCDLAKLYECKNGTKSINLAVNRNLIKFPNDFYFQITREEYYQLLRFQNETLDFKNSNFSKYLPYVFTEQGVAMLATVLHTPVAAEVSVNIMRTFVKMRKIISSTLIEQKYINQLVLEDHNSIKLLQESFSKLNEKQKINTIFYEGQIYDAYSLLIDILSKAKKEIIIIDNYAGKELLDIIKDISIDIKIVSSNIDSTLKKKYESQYDNVIFINNNTFHDRFIIIDRKELYNSGALFKDLGKKCFSLNKIEDIEYLENILIKIGI